MKKTISLLLITAFVFSLCSCAGKIEKTTETAPPEITAASGEITDVPASTSVAPKEMNEVIEDVSAYPAWYLGKLFSDLNGLQCGSTTTVNGQQNCELLGEDHNSVFPGVFFLFGEGAYGETGSLNPDALLTTVYTSGEAELYPGLSAGRSYNEYKQGFSISDLAYSEAYGCYFATSLFIVNGRDVTAYLFFYDKISLCTSVLMTVADKLDFSTIETAENERELYPVFYIGRNALSMKAKYGDDLYFGDDYDTAERKTAMLLKPDEELESEKVEETARIKNVMIYLPDYNVIPGVKVSSAKEEYFAAFRKAGESPEESEEGGAYLGTLFIAGYFVECFAMADEEDDTEIVSVRLLCKQLF